VSFLKEKTRYRPTRTELALAWVFTAAAGVAVALWFWKSCAR
jgi:hypothetical protein